MAGTLYIVATPIGNLEDITLRALRVLKEANVIAAEDTRHTKRLLNHFEIETPLTSFHQHSGAGKIADLIRQLLEGTEIALVTDGGTPGISDPGGELVEAAHEAGIPVVPVPGPSALVAALSVSGMRAQRFHFLGFAPRKPGDRRRLFEQFVNDEETLALYEAPYRVAQTLKSALETLGDRRAVVCREITKKFEEIKAEPLSEALKRFQAKEPKGEFVIVIEGALKKRKTSDTDDETTLSADED